MKEAKNKTISPHKPIRLSLEKEIDVKIGQCKEFLDSDSDHLPDEESGSDIEIDVFQKLPLPLRGAINREIEKKRSDQRELRREKDELKRWQTKIGYMAEDLENIVKEKFIKLETERDNFDQYKQVEQDRIKGKKNDSRVTSEINSLKREIERVEKSIKEQERIKDQFQSKRSL
jgi:chromosome segregation ATPase